MMKKKMKSEKMETKSKDSKMGKKDAALMKAGSKTPKGSAKKC